MFRTVPLSIIRSFFTVHTAMVYVIRVCWQLASRIRTTLHVSDSSSVHHQEFFHCIHSNGVCHTGLLTACEQDQDDSTCFGQFLCPSSGVFSLYTQQWYMSYGFAESLRAGSGRLYMFRTVPLSIIRSFFTVHTAVVYVVRVCWQLASRIRMTLHVSDSSSVHHQEFFSVYTAMVYVIQVCWQLASRIRTTLHVSDSSSVHHQEFFTVPFWSCSKIVSKPVCHIPLLCVQWKLLMMDRGTVRNM